MTFDFRNSSNPFVEQAIQYAIAAAKMSFSEKDKNDAFDRLLLQGNFKLVINEILNLQCIYIIR